MSITWDGIHHGTNAWNQIWGIRRSPEYGDPMSNVGISPPFGVDGVPRGESLIGTLWGNGMSLYAARPAARLRVEQVPRKRLKLFIHSKQ